MRDHTEVANETAPIVFGPQRPADESEPTGDAELPLPRLADQEVRR